MRYPTQIRNRFWRNGQFSFDVTGSPGPYLIQVSTDFVHWTTIGTIVNIRGTESFVDNQVGDAQRYYRVIAK